MLGPTICSSRQMQQMNNFQGLGPLKWTKSGQVFKEVFYFNFFLFGTNFA
jgi:hypothetical protein